MLSRLFGSHLPHASIKGEHDLIIREQKELEHRLDRLRAIRIERDVLIRRGPDPT